MTAVPARQTPYTVGEEVLRYLGLDPRAPEVQALVLLCERYNLDPVLGQAEIIGNRGKFSPYITRDGYLDIAHRSGQLDGIVVDEQRRNSSGDGWTAYVSVWRKDMAHPFRYGAQCKDTESQAKAGHGPEQAVARAERRALKRAFNVQAADPIDPGDGEIVRVDNEFRFAPMEPERPVELEAVSEDHDQVPETGSFTESEPRPASTNQAGWMTPASQGEAHRVIGALPKAEQLVFLKDHKIVEFAAVWPARAIEDALSRPF